MCKVDNIREKYNGQTKLYDFYRECYPTDTEMIEKINRNATFQDAFECLQVGFNFYAFLGVGDSLVRERIFDALATLMGCSYEHIYYQWLDHSQGPFGYQMVTDMNGLRFKNGNETAVRILNFVMPYIPEHIREEAKSIAFNE
jgi:hypothetical protein